MSLQDAINTGNGGKALDWTNIRLKSLNLDNNLNVEGNLNVDGILTAGAIVPAGIIPGAPRTFLHTDDLSIVGWVPFTADKISGGNDYDILTKDPILGWQSQQQLRNQNIPDPLIVNNITGTNTVTTANAIVTNITDSTVSAGVAGQVLSKSALNNLEWSNLVASSISGGVNGDLLKNVGGTWTYVPSISNSNLPDPLTVNTITGTTSVTTANIIPTNITDTAISIGSAGQVLSKSALNALEWNSLVASSISGGVNGDLLKNVGGTWTYVPSISNSNLPDPLTVNAITGTTSVSTANAIVTNITDSAASLGTAGQVLQKSSPGNALVWGGVNYVHHGITAVLGAYVFPTARAIVAFPSTMGDTSVYSLNSNKVRINNFVNETFIANFYANIKVSDSTTSFTFYLVLNGVDTVKYITPKIQAANTNFYSIVNIYARLTTASLFGQVWIECERTSGAGSMQVEFPAGVYSSLFSVTQA